MLSLILSHNVQVPFCVTFLVKFDEYVSCDYRRLNGCRRVLSLALQCQLPSFLYNCTVCPFFKTFIYSITQHNSSFSSYYTFYHTETIYNFVELSVSPLSLNFSVELTTEINPSEVDKFFLFSLCTPFGFLLSFW